MNTKLLSIASLVLFLAGCSGDDPAPYDRLDDTGLLGTWEISGQTINGITNSSVVCCEFNEFTVDDNPDDLRGNYRTYGTGPEATGTFLVNELQSTISVERSTDTTVLDYNLLNDNLTIEYMEDSTSIELEYVRIDD